MALSDQLRKLAERAQEAEKHAAAARDMAKAELEEDRKRSREDARQDAEQLRQAAEAARGKISDSWNDVQKSSNEHNAQVQKSIDTKIAEADLARAQRHADHAEADYAVINAQVARKHADELAAGAAASA
jgi:colicin import membrane protein